MKVLLIFTYGLSLEKWHSMNIINREISLYNEISKNRVHFTFLTFGGENDLNYSDKLANINILPTKNMIDSRIPKFHFLKSLILPFKLRRFIRDIDIIKTNQIQGSWIPCMAKIFYRKKIIIRGGYEWLIRYKMEYQYKKKKNYIKYLLNYTWIFINELIAYKLADGIILTNKSDISFIIKCFGLKNKYKKGRIKQFYNYIDVMLFKPINIPTKKDKNILFIGRLVRIKNLENLILSFKQLKNFKLDIVGKGPSEKYLKNIIRELKINANFLGEIPNSNLPELINQYEIYILPSFYEGNPKTLLEAMSCGIACIGTNTRGIKNLINHKENGYLCNQDSKSIKQAIMTIYNNKKLRDKISKNARNFILNNCSLKIISTKEYQFYKDLLNV